MGRPKEFDPEEALEKAMQVFWSRGYHDTSIRDLVEATGVNYYGLYGDFGNKHGLFLAALERYRASVTQDLLKELRGDGPVLPAIRRLFARLLKFAETEEGRRGCLMCNTAVELAPHDPAARAAVQANMAQLRDGFRAALERARSEGEIAAESEADRLAEFLAATAYSLGLLMRAGVGQAQAKRHLETALSTLG